MELRHEFEDHSLFDINCGVVRYWAQYGLADYRGDLDGFAECYPEKFKILQSLNLIREGNYGFSIY